MTLNTCESYLKLEIRMGESSQKGIKIDGILWHELDRWLKTQDAKKLGFHAKAQFATQAVRELLEQNKKGKADEYTRINRRLNSIESKLNEALGISHSIKKPAHREKRSNNTASVNE